VASIETPRLILIPCTFEDALFRIEQMSPEDRAEVSPEWLARVSNKATADVWTLGFAITLRATGDVIGGCGFKGPPSWDGIVEIAYGISDEYQGRGYATEAADALVQYAIQSGEVRLVIAHTLPENAASHRVLIKCGFEFVGEVTDPDDGLVWRWLKTI
jgi:ribosomal-protein-alanine N-acetyltransferase